jgi:ubiquinone/menaquinone biosynthesis C-methylase UbiE
MSTLAGGRGPLTDVDRPLASPYRRFVSSSAVDPFAAVAPFYDLDLEGYDDDIAMYRELAKGRGDAVLEFGCGTGRVAVPLARSGLAVTGVDVSAAMLARARERGAGIENGSLTLEQADMRDCDLRAAGQRFESVFVPLGGLQHMETAADVAAVFANIARHLAPGGLAVVDVEAPHPDDLTPGPQPLIDHWTRRGDGEFVTKLVAVEGRPSAMMKDVTWHFDVQPDEGPMRRLTAQFSMRVVTPGELELAARLAGLAPVGWVGDYDLSPVSDGDDRLIALLEHAT